MVEMRGKAVSDGIKARIGERLEEVKAALGRKPKLVIIRVGDNEADGAYARSALKKVTDFGMEAELCSLPGDSRISEFEKLLKAKSDDKNVDGILVLRPLPEGFEERAKLLLDPEKDLDGMTYINQARVFCGESEGFAPCTAAAVIRLLEHYGVELEGKHAVIAGRSNVVGKPLSMLLLKKNATVTLCHSKTLKEMSDRELSEADVICLAVGKAGFLSSQRVKESAVIVDAGINSLEGGGLTGDADYEALKGRCAMISPVPGGLGAVTTAVLCESLFEAARRRTGL